MSAVLFGSPRRSAVPHAGWLLAAAAFVVALVWAGARGLNPMLVLAAAALPAAAALGRRYAWHVLVVVLLVRPLVDDLGNFQLTAGLGAVVIVLAALLALHDARGLVILLVAAAPIVPAAITGAGVWGGVAWTEALRLLSIASVAAIVVTMPGRVDRMRVARVVQVSGLVPAAVAIVQAVTGTGTEIGQTLRSSGTLSQANPAAHFFGLCALASLVLAVEGTRARREVLILAFFAFAVATTGSIGGLVTFVVTTLAYLAFVDRFRSGRLFGALGGAAVMVVAVVLSPVGQGRLAEFLIASGPQVTDDSVTWRFAAWSKILESWSSHPFTGRGLGATEEGGVLADNIAHNEYLYVLAEFGIIGLVLLVVGIAAYLAGLARFRRYGAGRYNLPLAGAVLVSACVDAIADNPWHFSPSMFVVAALLAAVWRNAHEESTVGRQRKGAMVRA